MTKYLFTYRAPDGHTPGDSEEMAAWGVWFQDMGPNLVDYGNPVSHGSTVGDCGSDTRLNGYSVVTASDLESAVAVAKACPGLGRGMGVEVSELVEISS